LTKNCSTWTQSTLKGFVFRRRKIVANLIDFFTGPIARCWTFHFSGGLRPHGTHHQYHSGAAEQLRPAEIAQLLDCASRMRVERCRCFVCYSW
jgi:hypothetical protein